MGLKMPTSCFGLHHKVQLKQGA